MFCWDAKRWEASFEREENIKTEAEVNEPLPKVQVENNFGRYFEALDTICAPYLKYTTKMEISQIPEGWFVDTLDDKKLMMTFLVGDDGAPRKFNATTMGWWGDWNVSPYVERNDPDVLTLSDWSTTTITLSKKCYIFGFELSALLNMYNDEPVFFKASYLDTDNLPDDRPVGRIGQWVYSPGGARLFAVKSEVPFNRVTIYWTGGSHTFTRAYAITNIRYVTSRKIFEQHNN